MHYNFFHNTAKLTLLFPCWSIFLQFKALSMFSPSMRAEVLNAIHASTLSRIELLSKSTNTLQKIKLIHCMASHLNRRTYGNYETVAEQGHKARCLFILTNGNLTTQCIDIRRRSWATQTTILCPQSDFGSEAILFPKGDVFWDKTYKSENSMCDFLVITANEFAKVKQRVPGAMPCLDNIKRLFTYRRIQRMLRRPQSATDIINLIKAFRDSKRDELSMYNDKSDSLLKNLIEGKTSYMRKLEELTRDQISENIGSLSNEMTVKLHNIKNEMVKVSVSNLIKRTPRRHSTRVGRPPQYLGKPLHSPSHALDSNAAANFATKHTRYSSGSISITSGFSSGSIGYMDAVEHDLLDGVHTSEEY